MTKETIIQYTDFNITNAVAHTPWGQTHQKQQGTVRPAQHHVETKETAPSERSKIGMPLAVTVCHLKLLVDQVKSGTGLMRPS